MATELRNSPQRTLVAALKALLKERGLKYRHMAEALEISLPAVKRMMTDGDFPVSRLLSLCDWLGLDFKELGLLMERCAPEVVRFTRQQEEFFAENLSYLNYYFRLKAADFRAERVEREAGLSRRSSLRYLAGLEHIGLIERLRKGEIRPTHAAGAVIWDDHGPLGRKYTKRFVEEMCRQALDPEAKHVTIYTGERALTREQRQSFEHDLDSLIAKYRTLSSLNPGSSQGRFVKGVEPVSYLFLLNRWSDPFFFSLENT